MSSDQQVNLHTSAANALCENKPSDNQQCEKHSVVDNVFTNTVENEAVSISEGDTCQENVLQRSEINSLVDSTGTVSALDQVHNGNDKSADGDGEQTPSETTSLVVHHDQSSESPNDNSNEHETESTNCVDEPEPKQTTSLAPHPDHSTESPNENSNVEPTNCAEQAPNETTPLTRHNEQSAERSTPDNPNEHVTEIPSPLVENENLPHQSVDNDEATSTPNTSLDSANDRHVDEDELKPNDETSNDESEACSNEDGNELPDIVDFDGTDEVENDEYILDTVLRKPHRKERRRIVSANDDDSDPEIDNERERLLQSPTAGMTSSGESQADDTGNIEEDIELLLQNEKPGPKSKKISTQKLKELQARELLRNAVVIPSSTKKKKSRVIDSDDDEDNALLPYCVDVDDIGLPDTTVENENDDQEANSILLNDFEKPGSPSEVNTFDENAVKIEVKAETTSIKSEIPCETPCADLKQSVDEVPAIVKVEGDATKREAAVTGDSGNSTDSTNNQQCKKEYETTTETADFLPFPSSSSSEQEEYIPNDIYFGTPDHRSKKSARGRGGRRGRVTQTITARDKSHGNSSHSHRGRQARKDNFIDNRRTSSGSSSSSSESEDEYQKSKARRKPPTITIVKQPLQLYQKGSLPIRPNQKQIHGQIRRKRDRFPDQSQAIPNSIYFGDVDVPLHVLHAYDDSDSDNGATPINHHIKLGNAPTKVLLSSHVSRGRGSRPMQYQSDGRHHVTTKSIAGAQTARSRAKATSVSPSNDRSIQMMKKCLKAAGLKKVKLNRLWEGCKSNSERAEKMLELLREKGLEGEPTISKCKQLKVDYLTKKEIEDLDPNLIIQTEGRTTRRSTRAATKRQYTYDEEEILETRTKLRNVIDSDSDFD